MWDLQGDQGKLKNSGGLIKNMRLIQSNGLSAATEIHPLCSIVEYKCFELNYPAQKDKKQIWAGIG